MKNTTKRPSVLLGVEALEERQLLSTATPKLLSRETFDSTLAGTLTPGWSQWSNQGSFDVAVGQGPNHSRALVTQGTGRQKARVWYNTSQQANIQVSANLLLNSLIPTQVLARGSDLSGYAPNYYAVQIERGLGLKLVRVIDGQATTLADLRSTDWFSGQWVRVGLRVRDVAVGSQTRPLVEAVVQRLDTNEYLNSDGDWQADADTALSASDASSSAIRGGGFAGLARTDGFSGAVALDDFRINALASNGSVGAPTHDQNFDLVTAGDMPADWSQWDSEGPFAASTTDALSGQTGMVAEGTRGQESRAWMDTPVPADVQVSSAVHLTSLVPASVFLRGSNLTSSQPSYYAARVARGMDLELIRVVNGATTVLGHIRSVDYLSDAWVQVSLTGSGRSLEVQVQRLDTNQYLTLAGRWQTASTSALQVTDSSSAAVTAGGYVGLARTGDYEGKVTFDNFSVTQVTPAPFNVNVTGLTNGATVTSNTTVTVTAEAPGTLSRVEFYVDNIRQATDSISPFNWTMDPTKFQDGNHTLLVVGFDPSNASSRKSLSFTTRASTSSPGQPNIPQHYSWIRLAQLAYGGMDLTAFEEKLLRQSVDLVIPNREYLSDIKQAAPNTPAMIYTNVSSLYLESLTDWLNWADGHRVDREGAFYHTQQRAAFSGDSGSSQPVNWFWGVWKGGVTPEFIDLTVASRNNSRSVSFAGLGTSIYIGYTEKFREINFNFATVASHGWKGVFEYATEVDAAGNPIRWKTLSTISDGTAGLTRSGRIAFDPPADWKTGKIGSSDRLFYVRVRATATGTAPVANTILGRDYVGSNGGTRGTIPAFDAGADTNHDGYLNEAEFSHHASGKDARFLYESRVFQGSYGQMRPATNPSNPSFRQWAVDYHTRYLKQYPLASGLFVDNSHGKAVLNDIDVVESTATYSNDYGTLLNTIGKAVAPRWVLANTSGGGTDADGVVRQNAGYYEEFAIRALAHNYAQFETLAAQVDHRSGLKNPSTLAVLDSLPTGGSPTDARTQIATLAYYYLLQDPKTTFLNFFGGYEPSSSWTRHWSEAVKYDVGQPLGDWSLFASGADPANRSFTYRIYQRSYGNALVLYKPLSYNPNGSKTGTLSNSTATTHKLNGVYRPLRADGTLGAPITSITLRNGEGAILVRATG